MELRGSARTYSRARGVWSQVFDDHLQRITPWHNVARGTPCAVWCAKKTAQLSRMARKDPQPLSALMHELMRKLDAGSKLGEATIVSAWQDVSGPQIAKVTEKVWVEKKRLFVKIQSAPWRYELHLQRRDWVDRVNEKLGKRMIEEVIFR